MLHRFREPASGLNGIHDPSVLRACLEELRRARTPILSLDDLVSRALRNEPIPVGTVVFTLDDGFWDQGEIGAELFLQYDVPITIFLITGLQDGALWPWDDRLAYVYEQSRERVLRFNVGGCSLEQHLEENPASRRAQMRETRAVFKTMCFHDLDAALETIATNAGVEIPLLPPERHRPIGWSAARALEKRGVTFGPHTVSHGIVSRMNQEDAMRELLDAWTRLKSELAAPLDIYGWPTGRTADFGERDINILRAAGFRAAVATEDDYAAFPSEPNSDQMFRLKRFGLPATLPEFTRYRSWIERGNQIISKRTLNA